ncbi:MAG: glucan biosynthesis glucosyltransferase H [Rhodospirillales bacterium 69-11]|nr:glucans biosynthesis glucosyltransferase MdoH [Rhodospirillales bacterium]OJW31325.1 MAG: glucan biosynthesis glucosyltransferase H [Rhodospirillales bacterium 69-11]
MDAGLIADAPAAFRALPDPAPLPMPTQSLWHAPPRRGRLPSSPRAIGLRRFLVIGPAIALTAFGGEEMYRVLAVNGLTPLAVLMLALFLALFAWIALSFTSALAGFVSLVARRRSRLMRDAAPATRTALLMPTYNESPHRVMAGLQAIAESLQATGAADRFDIFILSDTTNPDVWIEEEAAFLRLRGAMGDQPRIFYRRRAKNTARKAGNIADWVTRFGGAYPQFLILDADSVMAGDTLLQLVATMEAHPDVGLVQTLPIITGGSTFFARMQQFAGRVYGPLIAHGIAWWHGAEGNYWGHNALIRTQAFAENGGLPELRGRKPFGGHILSHDFVEAALIRRGGWAVHMLPALRGSYEESPPSLTDLAIRDRRWCQGNLQHAAVLPARGLHWVSRLHLLTGIGSYVTAPLWLAFLLCGILISLQARFITPDYFPAGKSLFPQWPVIDPVRAMWVFIGTMALLLIPKLLGTFAVLLRGPERRGCGGTIRLLASVILETIVAGLLAPVVMLTQSTDVIAILLGRDSGWNAQRRDDGSIPLRETARAYRRHTLLGLALAGIAWAVSPSLAIWMTPVILGLALAIPLAALTGQRKVGLALRRLGLLRIPEEMAPPPELARAMALQRAEPASPELNGVQRLLADPALLAAHRAMLPPPRRPRVDPIEVTPLLARAKLAEAETLADGWAALTPAERAAALADAEALDRMVALAR